MPGQTAAPKDFGCSAGSEVANFISLDEAFRSLELDDDLPGDHTSSRILLGPFRKDWNGRYEQYCEIDVIVLRANIRTS